MYLFLDPSHEGSVTLQITGLYKKSRPSQTVQFSHSEELLKIIDEFLNTQKVNPQQLNGIIVVNDAPRFTTIRNVITILNTMAWQLNIPIVANVKCQNLNTKSMIKKMEKHYTQPAIPHYSAPPTITLAPSKKVDKMVS